jgi:hypothetical protein
MRKRTYAHLIHVLPCLLSIAGSTAQTLTDATSVPAVGTAETRSYHTDFTATGFATSGTGNLWFATGLIPSGITKTIIYRTPSDSPHAATYPGTTLCAESIGDTPPAEWLHFNVNSSIAELLGVNTDEFVGGRTYCEFPFDMGDQFSDSYTISGTTLTDDIEYAASGEILTPWGTVPDVVMFAVNGGSSYLFYMTANLLDPIGSYVPGFGMDLWQVEIVTGHVNKESPELGVWPVPARDFVWLAMPFAGGRVIMTDATGRTVREMNVTALRTALDISDLPSGIYTVTCTGDRGGRSSGRIVVQ